MWIYQFVDNAVRQLTESRGDEGTALVDFVAKDERVKQSTIMITLNTSKVEQGPAALSELTDGFVMAIVK
jgi:hypothetical protein